MSGEDRDLQALRERRDARPAGAFEEEDITKPHDLIQIEGEKYKSDTRYRDEMNAINVRYQNDPAFRALWNMMRRQRHESNRTLGKVADVANDVHHDVHQLKDLAERLQNLVEWKHRVDTSMSIVKWVAGFVLAATLGSVIVIATKIYTWGVNSGELEARLKHLEQAMERRSRSSNDFSYPAATSTTRTP
jgi:DNA repair ATPase RecN